MVGQTMIGKGGRDNENRGHGQNCQMRFDARGGR